MTYTLVQTNERLVKRRRQASEPHAIGDKIQPPVRPSLDRRQFLASLALSPFLPRLAGDKTTLRVASLDWALAETMFALGHKPIAILDAASWNKFVVEPPLPPGVADLGLSTEINFELLASLKPDLILTSPFVQELTPSLRRIGETLSLSVFEPASAPFAQQRALTRTLGERLGSSETAENYLAGAEQIFDSYRARITALHPLPVLLVNFMDGRHVRVCGGSGLYQNVLDRIGVTNSWTGETNYWGYSTVGIEKLATGQNLRLIAFEPIPADTYPTLQRSPLWSQLPFVKAGHVSVLPTVLMFGALPSALRFARLLVEHLESLPK
jgi:ferric hydroxamate transport system substrate-binding protein